LRGNFLGKGRSLSKSESPHRHTLRQLSLKVYGQFRDGKPCTFLWIFLLLPRSSQPPERSDTQEVQGKTGEGPGKGERKDCEEKTIASGGTGGDLWQKNRRRGGSLARSIQKKGSQTFDGSSWKGLRGKFWEELRII